MKTDSLSTIGLAMFASAAIGIAACGGNGTPSPAAPTIAAVASADSHGGGGNSGGNSGSGNNGGPGNSNTANPNKQVELTGTVQTVTGTCSTTLHLTIAGRSVSTTAQTEFKDTTCAAVAAGQTAEVKGTLQTDNSVIATRIEVKGNDADNEHEGEVRGAITASTGACPALTLTIGTTKVKTTAATVFDDAACSALAVGTVIEAKGTTQSDGSLLASRIEPQGVR
jgi:hypothetical protein